MKNELVTSLSEAFPKLEITSQCENKILDIVFILDKCLVQSDETRKIRDQFMRAFLDLNGIMSRNYLFEIDQATGQPKEKFPK